jgi:Na+-driven multidrug efflux pump
MKKTLFCEYARYVTLQVLGMVGLSVYILADTFFIARWLGADGLAALNIALPVFSVINGLALMLGMGGGARFMLRKSCGEYGEACQVFTRTVRIAAGFAGLIVLLGLVRAEAIASLLGADAETLGMTTVYLRTIMLCAPLFTANHILLSFLRNDGAPKLAMTSMLTGSFANIVLDWLMIYVLQWGMFGAAFATCLSPIISICVTLPHLLRRRNTFHLYRTEFSSRQCSFYKINF